MDLNKRCDNKLDCQDKSDETNCERIKIDRANYQKVIPPILDKGRTNISIEMDIYSVTNIDELAMSFNAEVRINLQWTDPRHDYKHLKNNANFLGTYHILHYHVLDIFGPHSSTHLIRKCHYFPIPIYRPYMTTTNAHTPVLYTVAQ